MSWGIVAGAVISAGAAYYQSRQQKKAAGRASAAQQRAAELGTEEQRRQFDQVRELLAPYVEAGTGSLAAQKALVGLGPPGSEQAAIEALQRGPQFQSMLKQGEASILQQASATGGLRGGNTQAALAEFSPGLLAGLIQQRFQNLGGITSLGQNAAAMTGNAGMTSAANISNLLQQMGAAQAGQALATGQAQSQAAGTYGQALGTIAGRYYGTPNQQQQQGSKF